MLPERKGGTLCTSAPRSAVIPPSFPVRLALFRVIDLLLNCAMKDGLNLLPFEYVLTKSTQQSTGVVVLSGKQDHTGNSSGILHTIITAIRLTGVARLDGVEL